MDKYHRWQQGLRNAPFADLLFVTALNLAEERRGGLLVVLDDPHAVRRLMSHSDLLSSTPGPHPVPGHASKDQFHYLLSDKCVLTLPTTIEQFHRTRSRNYRKKVGEFERLCDRLPNSRLRMAALGAPHVAAEIMRV